MRRFLLFALSLALFILPLGAQNPISPEGVYIADPSARIDDDGRMYIYGSLDVKQGTYCSDHYHVLSSKDLTTWKLRENSFKADTILYAPDMIRVGNTYYLYYDDPSGREFVATAASPEGPFTDGVLIEGPEGIDPNIFIDDDGQAYYFWGQFSAKGARMNPDMKTIDKASIVEGIVTEKDHYFHEGSFVFKRGKYYYYTYADISRQRPTCIGYAMSTSPLGPYEYKGVIIDNHGCDPKVWNNHGSVIEYGGQWYILYHRATHAGTSMRKACIEPITFREDGTIVEAEMTSQGASGPLDAYSLMPSRRMCVASGNVRIAREIESEPHEILSEIRDGDKVAFKYLDFGDSVPARFTARVRGNGGGRIDVVFDQFHHGTALSLGIPEGSSDWVELSCEIPPKAWLQGVHAIWLSFSVPEGGTLDLDWFRFSK